ncbi:hypothetical protein GNE08_20125 [Trichormus variabilis ARAD]|uniref:Uncharacterized protein n=1 Tax=Trichormus variabilis N2B TaxID=2681315 RepID=A0ABR6SEI0_ANAVA|nr:MULTISPECIES: hypothetical protein [Nostocaceae]MBC1216523.1 hypothetical protein [Trichormus variabilis ARAD]MBC1257584.1 hypothetical protein [Trichormus variabilis V5]MBC1268689.1 hypothetical protein [Trichormus variabilis FSR]MBC1304783.1 hypothetical protein [Trichormus variabilis N2B]MBC1313511.1 hypothetical protein [Trichormus variabilis PNB]
MTTDPYGSAVALSRGTRRQSLQVGKAAHSAVSPTHCFTTDNCTDAINRVSDN